MTKVVARGGEHQATNPFRAKQAHRSTVMLDGLVPVIQLPVTMAHVGQHHRNVGVVGAVSDSNDVARSLISTQSIRMPAKSLQNSPLDIVSPPVIWVCYADCVLV